MGYVYEILNIQNNKKYIGSTKKDPKIRKTRHITTLRNGTHHNVYLQRAFNKYGEKSFQFNILEKDIPEEKVFERELSWIVSTKPEYNIGSVGEETISLNTQIGKILSIR